MTHLRPILLSGLCVLLLAYPVKSQSNLKLFRVSAEETKIIFPGTVEKLEKVGVLIPQTGLIEITSFSFNSAKKVLTIQLPRFQEIEAQIAKKRKPYIYLPEVKLLGQEESFHDQLVRLPGFEMAVKKVTKDRDQIVLEQVYVPQDLQGAVANKDAWIIKAGTKPYPVMEVGDVQELGNSRQRVLTLDRPMPSNSKGSLSLQNDPAKPPISVGKLSTEAIGKGEENLFLGFTLNSSSGRATVFGAKISTQHDLWSGYLKRGGLGLKLTPRFNLKANSGNQDDENSLDFSLALTGRKSLDREKLEAPFNNNLSAPSKSKNPFESIRFLAAAKFEADRQFRNENLIFDSETRLLFKLFGPKNKDTNTGIEFDFQAFLGWEAGKNLKNAVAVLDGNQINRFKGGSIGAIKFEIKRPSLESITLRSAFIHRQLFATELFTRIESKTLPAGTLIPIDTSAGNIIIPPKSATLFQTKLVSIAEGSRNYVDTSMIFDFKRIFDFSVSYLYGELPPTYERVNKFELGFVIRLGQYRNRY